MDHLRRYLRTHLAGATAGVDLFERVARGLPDEKEAAVVRELHAEIVEDRQALLDVMAALDIHANAVLDTVASAAEKVGRLKPNGDLLRRTRATDLVELEGLRDAVSAKLSGWEALLAIAAAEPRLDREQLLELRRRAKEQSKRLRRLHAAAAKRALGPKGRKARKTR